MQIHGQNASQHGLEEQEIHNVGNVYWNLSTPLLYEEAVRRRPAFSRHVAARAEPKAAVPSTSQT